MLTSPTLGALMGTTTGEQARLSNHWAGGAKDGAFTHGASCVNDCGHFRVGRVRRVAGCANRRRIAIAFNRSAWQVVDAAGSEVSRLTLCRAKLAGRSLRLHLP